VVVQCPTCQSKFRIADEKVTDRGVRVRCTSCKNVFQVRKPGTAATDPAPGPGTTMDLSSLGASAVGKPVRGKSGAGGRPSTGPVRPATGPVRPSTDKVRRAASLEADDAAARRLDADDLFGMAELTGDAPLAIGGAPPAPAELASPAAGPASLPGFDDLDLEIEAPPSKSARPPPPPPEPVRPPPPLDPPMPPPDSVADAGDPAEPMKLDDPFAEIAPGGSAALANGATAEEKPARPRTDPLRPRTDPLRPRTDPLRPKTDPLKRQAVPKSEPIRAAESEISAARALWSSAITGLLGAALAIVVVIASALSDDAASGWLGFGAATDVIATGVVSGLYDTVGGKPVFYVRGRVENHSRKVRGPVHVTAELVADGSPEAKADAIAGSEPTPEDVWAVRSAADVEKLTRSLQAVQVERRLAPGGSLPFFAVIPDPPPDLVKHRLRVRIETVDAWTQPGAKAARNR
jgi:predicted Zn finger-like uncharacterized protein